MGRLFGGSMVSFGLCGSKGYEEAPRRQCLLSSVGAAAAHAAALGRWRLGSKR